MTSIAYDDLKINKFNKKKKSILSNLANVRKQIIIDNNSENILEEYNNYFNQLTKEKQLQIKTLEIILKHLEKVNSDAKIVRNKSIDIMNDNNKIKTLLSQFQDELNNIEK